MRKDTRLTLGTPDANGDIPIVSIHPQARPDATVGYIVARVCYSTVETEDGKGKEPTADTREFARLFKEALAMREALELAEATIVRLNRHDSANGTLDVIRGVLARTATA